jgi:hypothetical protein
MTAWRSKLTSVRDQNIGYVHHPPATEVRANSSSPLKWTGKSLVHFSGLELLAWGLIPRWLRTELAMTEWRSKLTSVRDRNIGYVHHPPATEVRANSSSPLKWTGKSLVHL